MPRDDDGEGPPESLRRICAHWRARVRQEPGDYHAGWPKALEGAAQMTGPLVMVSLYLVCKFAAVASLIPARWDMADSAASAGLLAGTVLLVARHAARVAEHARLVEGQRQQWAQRLAAVRGDGTDAAIADRVEMCEVQLEVAVATLVEMCEEAGVGHLADKAVLRLVRDSSRRPA